MPQQTLDEFQVAGLRAYQATDRSPNYPIARLEHELDGMFLLRIQSVGDQETLSPASSGDAGRFYAYANGIIRGHIAQWAVYGPNMQGSGAGD